MFINHVVVGMTTTREACISILEYHVWWRVPAFYGTIVLYNWYNTMLQWVEYMVQHHARTGRKTQ